MAPARTVALLGGGFSGDDDTLIDDYVLSRRRTATAEDLLPAHRER